MPVQHPEQLHVNPEADLFTLWIGPQWNLIDIASVESITAATKAKKSA